MKKVCLISALIFCTVITVGCSSEADESIDDYSYSYQDEGGSSGSGNSTIIRRGPEETIIRGGGGGRNSRQIIVVD